MSKSVKRLENALAKMKHFASKLNVLLLVLLVADCAFILIMLMFQLSRFVSSGHVGFDLSEFMPLVSSIMDFVLYAIVLAVAKGVTKDIACGRSPFSLNNAKRINLIGWFLVVSFMIGFFNSPNYSLVSTAGALELGIQADELGKYPALFIDIKSLVGAAVGFLISGAWKYGALLQADSDDIF